MAKTDYQSELLEIWQNKRFSDSIAAKVYDGINTRSPESSNKPMVEWKVFMACVIEHSKCNGQIVTENYAHHCFCPCHRFLLRESSSKSIVWGVH